MPSIADNNSAASKHGAPKPKKFHTKTRNSCGSCRRRRVKCTLEKPSCKACVRLDLPCEYRSDRVSIDVRRLDGGQIIAIPITSKALLPPHFDNSKIDFWISNTLPLTTSVGPPPNAKGAVIPSLFINKDGRSVFDNAYKSFDRMWRLLTLPLAYNDKGMFDMLALLGKQHQLALQPDGSQQAFRTQAYAQMLCMVSSVTKRCSPEVALAAISTLYAYERLASAATATEPPDRFTIHSNAMKSIATQSKANENIESYFTKPLQFSMSLHKFFSDRSQSPGIDIGTLMIPDEFTDFYDARDCFFDILKSNDDNDTIRKHMARWGVAMRILFGRCKEKDWNEAKRALTMLTEFEFLRSSFEASTQPMDRNRVEEVIP